MGFAKEKSPSRVENTDSGKKEFSCKMCGKIFDCERRRNLHFLTHIFENNYKCEECGQSFPRDYVLNLHLLLHRDKNVECGDCGKYFEFRDRLLVHKLKHFELGKYQCKDCKKYFLRKCYFKNHRNLNCEKRQVEKNGCGESSTTEDFVVNNGQDISEKSFQSDGCRDLNSGSHFGQTNSGSDLQNNTQNEPVKSVNSDVMNVTSEDNAGNGGNSSAQEKELVVDDHLKFEDSAIFYLRIGGCSQESIQEEIQEQDNANEDFTPTTTLENDDQMIAEEGSSELDENSAEEEILEDLECFESSSQNNDKVDKQVRHNEKKNDDSSNNENISKLVSDKHLMPDEIDHENNTIEEDLETSGCEDNDLREINWNNDGLNIFQKNQEKSDECLVLKENSTFNVLGNAGKKQVSQTGNTKNFKINSNTKKDDQSGNKERQLKLVKILDRLPDKNNRKYYLRTRTKLRSSKRKNCCRSCESNVSNHRKVHLEEKSLKCEESFLKKRHLKNHLRSLNKEKLYKCQECNISFKSKNKFDVHQKMHSGGKSYKCEECNRSFSQEKFLKLHQRTHAKKKSFKKQSKLGKSVLKEKNCNANVENSLEEEKEDADDCGEKFSRKDFAENNDQNIDLEKDLEPDEVENDDRSNRENIPILVRNECVMPEENYREQISETQELERSDYDESDTSEAILINVVENDKDEQQNPKKLSSPEENEALNLQKSIRDEQFVQAGDADNVMIEVNAKKGDQNNNSNDNYYKTKQLKSAVRSSARENKQKYNLRTPKKRLNFQVEHCDKSFVIQDNLKSQSRIHIAQKPFQCDECKKCFSRKDILTNHLRTHNRIEAFECSHCNKTLSSKIAFSRHLKMHTEKPSYKCEQCHRSFWQKSSLTSHQRIHSGEKPFQCNECKKCFSRKDILKNHLQTHNRIEAFECAHCNKTLSSKIALRRHLKMHTEKHDECTHCNKILSSSTSLKLHERIHTGEKPYQCKQCNRCFSRIDNLKSHQRFHTGEKPYKCEQCNRCFSQMTTLKDHQRIHTGEKPYQCKQCNRCFSDKSALRSHQKNHTREKLFQCFECKKGFSRNFALQYHLRIHTGEKPFQCKQCNRCFSQKSHLTRHQIIHTGEKPFQCDECKKWFSRKNRLADHLRTHIRE